jgi:formylmethanofuran dehydrogenase subunit C
MTTLTFTLKSDLNHSVDCRLLTPNLLAGLSIAEINNLSLGIQKVSDLFEVSGDVAKHANDKVTENIVFKNSISKLDYIGYKMSRGSITIQGDAGDFLGASLQKGTIICQGNAGDRVGDQMRRGLILIDGNVGDYAASRMIAGTIGVYGKVGNYIGFNMKRGTLLLTQKPRLHATIQDCGTHTLPFLALLFASFKPLASAFNKVQSQRVQRFGGDLACGGNGEILLLLT